MFEFHDIIFKHKNSSIQLYGNGPLSNSTCCVIFQAFLVIKISECQMIQILVKTDVVGPDLGPNCLQRLSVGRARKDLIKLLPF